MKGFDCLSDLGAFLDALVEKVHRHPAMSPDPTERMGRTIKRKIKDRVDIKDEKLIDPLPSLKVSLPKVLMIVQ